MAAPSLVPGQREAAGCSISRPDGAQWCSAEPDATPVDLAIPQLGDDAAHALGEVAAVGAERQTQHLGGGLLGGGRAQVGAVDGPQQLVVPGGCWRSASTAARSSPSSASVSGSS